LLLVLSPALHNEQVVAPPSYAPHAAPLAALYCHTLLQKGNLQTTAGHLLP
jgi:hypothetical protein